MSVLFFSSITEYSAYKRFFLEHNFMQNGNTFNITAQLCIEPFQMRFSIPCSISVVIRHCQNI